MSARADGDRLDHLAEISGLLWPAPARAGLGVTGGEVISEFVLVPDAKRPRLLVPAAHRRAAAAAVRRHTEPGSVKRRLLLGALSAALGSGLGGLAMRRRFRVCTDGTGPVGTIETYLRDALDPDLVISLAIGPARANRKPVLQLLTPGGETLGFAKVGVNDLTRSLARAERDALRSLAAATPRQLTVPEVRHYGRWNDLDILVLTPLPIWEPRVPRSTVRLNAAMLEIAQIGGVTEGPLRTSPYWIGLGERITALPAGDGSKALLDAYGRIGATAGDTRLRYGSWHGDWTPWNMATLRDTLLVWDWERFATGVPIGFDAIHYAFQDAVVRRATDPRAAMGEVVAAAAELLAPFDVTDAAPLTTLLYFADIATRYLQDEQAKAGARLGQVQQWLLPALAAEIEQRLHR
jgi:hypothetical protein